MDHKILNLLSSKLEERIGLITNDLGNGVAKDYPEYQNQCGVIRGLLTAQADINDLLRRMKEHDDE
jgi:hypothetical protein